MILRSEIRNAPEELSTMREIALSTLLFPGLAQCLDVEEDSDDIRDDARPTDPSALPSFPLHRR